MLPSVVASELEQVAADAIRTAFHPTTPGFSGLSVSSYSRAPTYPVPCLSIRAPAARPSPRGSGMSTLQKNWPGMRHCRPTPSSTSCCPIRAWRPTATR